MKWFPLTTQRLYLREFTADDEEAVHEYGSDPRVSQYDSWGPNTREETRVFLTRHIEEQARWPRDEVGLAVTLRDDGVVIGSVRFWIADRNNGTGEFGYAFNQRYWNRGYATEAARAILTVAFSPCKLHRVLATCDTRNTRSWRLLERLGMRREACFRRDKFQKGEWRDSYLYAILADEWSGRKPTAGAAKDSAVPEPD